jgi:hypothetical protein
VRSVTLRGSFSRTGAARVNSFRFTGRLLTRRLAAGSYRLVATPAAGGKTGRTVTATFTIVR